MPTPRIVEPDQHQPDLGGDVRPQHVLARSDRAGQQQHAGPEHLLHRQRLGQVGVLDRRDVLVGDLRSGRGFASLRCRTGHGRTSLRFSVLGFGSSVRASARTPEWSGSPRSASASAISVKSARAAVGLVATARASPPRPSARRARGSPAGRRRARAVVQPLPHLGAGDLRGRGVLHQVVDADRAGAAQPGLEVLDADADVRPQAGLGDLTRRPRDVEQLLGGDVDVLAGSVALVGSSPSTDVNTSGTPRPCRGGRPTSRRSRRRPRGSCRRATLPNACRLISSSLLGMNAAIPPMAWAPRLWQVRTSSSV